MLNSKIIDVDKLDYLIRDAYITGFDTVNLDYHRLLEALIVIIVEERSASDGFSYQIAYHKSAVSIIENVIYAHDSERKWIQNHPIILYESYLLRHIMSSLQYELDSDGRKLFSFESLTEEGQSFDKEISIRYMCDDDIIYLMKNIYYDDAVKEYFERNLRRHPIWKSEAEYRAFFFGRIKGGEVLNDFENAMDQTVRYLTSNTASWIINDDLYNKLRSDINCLKKGLSGITDGSTVTSQIKTKSSILKIFDELKAFAEKNKLEFEFVLISTSQFASGFSKADFSKLKLVFSLGGQEFTVGIEDTVASLKGREKERDKLYYIFYKRPEGFTNDLNHRDLCNKLLNAFML